ncbi:DNA-binding protein [Halobellus sp. EA9]|uniref:DNA-binding protein n=1 Tax=Halobellus sp. EA9 TaxID=3421647 RepID=UPI003EB9B7A9
MSRWLQSGRRRDLCALLYEAGTLRGQKLKTSLERHYDTRLDPQSFYGSLDALVDRGLVAVETEGIHDVYRLTEAGIDGVESHHRWLTARVEGGSGTEPDGDAE